MTEHSVYLTFAILGTVLFVLKLLASFHGFDGDFDFDSHDVHSADHSFEIFSIQSLLAFMMGAGWSGLSFREELGFNQWTTLLAAVGFGVGTALLSSTILYLAFKLERATPQAKPSKGMVGRTYLSIPLNGTGQVELVLGGRKQIINAKSEEAIPSHASVKVVEVLSDDLVKVEKA